MSHMTTAPRRRADLRLLRKLEVDIEGLEEAFESEDIDGSWYLDIQRGSVSYVDDDDTDRARFVASRLGTRYLPIPQDEPADQWQDMEAFLDHVGDGRLRRKLRGELRGREAAPRFRMLLHDASLYDEWSVFQQQRLRGRILDWLACVGIAAFFDID